MRKSKAKPMICGAFRDWCHAKGKTDPDGNDGLAFYCDLDAARSPLLSFQNSGDKWQPVHVWLLSERLVSD